MLTLPASLSVKRNTAAELTLTEKAKAWVEKDERTPGIHASDMLDPRRGYWQRIKPLPLDDRLAAIFLVGRVLHGFVLNAVDDKKGLGDTDEGSNYSEELGLWWSPDKTAGGKVRELKTSRSFQEPAKIGDLRQYLEQLLVYMAATNTTDSQLWVLFLNLKDEQGRTSPQFRAYDVVITEEELKAVQADVKATRDALQTALEAEDPASLPLCRDWLCSRKMCPYWDNCKPEGRYDNPKLNKKG